MDPNGGTNPFSPRPGDAPQSQNQFANADISSPVTSQPPVVAGLDSIDFGTDEPSAVDPLASMPSEPFIAQAPEKSNQKIQKPGKKSGGALKKVLLILMVFIIATALAGGAYFVGFTAGQSKGKAAAEADYQKRLAALQEEKTEDKEKEEEPASTAVEEGDLSLGDLKEPKYIDETLEGEIGRQVEASDGLVLKVTNIERNFKSTDTNYKLDSSKELIKVNFLVGNVTKDKTKDIGNFNFRLENATNAQLTPENVAGYPDKFDTLKLEPGAQSKGSIVYAVNKDEKPLKFVREQRYRIAGENREVTTRIVISVAKQ